MDLNKVMLIGRLAQDPELRNLPSGGVVASFSVATGRQWVDKAGEKQKQTEFHRIVAWGKLAERIGQYLHKGKPVYIEGRLQTRDWTGDDGVKRYRTEVIATSLIMLGSKTVHDPAVSETSGVDGVVAQGSVASEEGEELIEEEVKVEELPF